MTNTADQDGPVGVPAEPELDKSGKWMKMFRRLRFDNARDGVRGATIKAVGTMLATYADYDDGTDIRPGTARVAIDCEIDYRTAKRCIAVLRDLGLIVLTQKADRRGHSDVYRLGWPQDLVGRSDVVVWDPDRYHLEIALVREKHRGKYKPAAKDLRGTEGTAEVTSFETAPDESAGHAGHRRTESAGHAGTNLRGTPCPPTYQGTYQGLVPSDEIDLSAEVTVSRASSHEDPISPPADLSSRPRCPHGRSSRRNKDRQLRCPDCNAAEVAAAAVEQIEQAASTTQVGPSRCAEHGLPAHRCVFCRRGLRGG